ncbi:MAG: ribosome silencing factor [Oscillospiraceae bacterium]|nr:ribosome silencing factor [Oscillospiraceae bacterium]MBR2080288.1 ribosome silencing factor [Oscillospiraceae bacterium]MBR2366371.1 ribosome silencing factor [Oscillospiraceae bacterium]MBR2897169.1 ribosome silencing factor [Oscillospiraceae bacterium]MBR3849173.1 ribosome silencing factor [Oscillospiraceae bacterium]
MTTKEIMQRAAAALDDKMGKDITVLKIADVSTLADYFLICTGTSSTQIRALCDAVEEAMDQAGETLISREGHRGGTWILLDYGSIVVHIFTDETRKFYDLERLWSDAVPVDISEI